MTNLRIDNAMVWSGVGERPEPASITIDRGRIIAIGGAAAAAELIDVQGAVVTPGLVDAHMHLLMGGECLLGVDLSGVLGRDEFEACLETAHRDLEPGQWLIAAGWDETRWAHSGMPDRTWFAAVGDRPAVAWRCDRHAIVVNDVVLEMLDLPGDAAMAARGGRIVRGPDGTATGLMVEAAAWELVNPNIEPYSTLQRADALEQACTHLLGLGITAVRTMEYRCDVEKLLAGRAGSLPIRVSVVQLDRELPLDTGWVSAMPRTDRFHVGGCKSFFDGTLGSRTARLSEPYADSPGNCGLWAEHALRDEDGQWLASVVEAGLAPVVHAIGDAAVRRAARLLGSVDPALRPTIEHAEVVLEEDLPLLEGLRTSVQPIHRADDARMAAGRLGPERAGRVLPLREMIDVGARLSFGTDWPIVGVDPLPGLVAAVTGARRDGQPFHPGQAITPLEAMRAQTVDAAEAIGFVPGLTVGSPADLVVWEGDPLTDPAGARVRATVVDGTLVAGAWPGRPVQEVET